MQARCGRSLYWPAPVILGVCALILRSALLLYFCPPLLQRLKKSRFGRKLQRHCPNVRENGPELYRVFFGTQYGHAAGLQRAGKGLHGAGAGVVGQGVAGVQVQACGGKHGKETFGQGNASQGHNGLLACCPVAQRRALPVGLYGAFGELARGRVGSLPRRQGGRTGA